MSPLDKEVLATIPAKQVMLSDVIKILEKEGKYRFIIVDKKFSNDNAVMDSLIHTYGIETIKISK
jgi:tRNA A37 threonylcarbamoyltransferase TsaD